MAMSELDKLTEKLKALADTPLVAEAVATAKVGDGTARDQGMEQQTFGCEAIKQLAADLGPASMLYALSAHNDPFFILPSRRAEAEWFARLWMQFLMGTGSHIRRMHYKLISRRTPVKTRADMPYENTLECWAVLAEASKGARYLDLVSADDFVIGAMPRRSSTSAEPRCPMST
jgi:hypothetical protein